MCPFCFGQFDFVIQNIRPQGRSRCRCGSDDNECSNSAKNFLGLHKCHLHKGHCRFGENKKKMTSGSAQRKPLPGGYHLLLSYYLAVRLRVSPRDFHPHLSIFLEKDEPWMSRTSKPNNFVAWSQPVGFPLLLIIRFAKSAETKKERA